MNRGIFLFSLIDRIDKKNISQVVEIASYTEHLLTECEAKTNYQKCPRCTEAIPKSDYDEHIAAKSCNCKLYCKLFTM